MQDIQSVFMRIQQNKKKLKDLKTVYNDALKSNQEYQDIQESMKTLREKKKRIDTVIKEQFANEITQMEDLKIDIQSDMEMISDIAMTQVMKGESVSLKDEYETEYEPVFNVKFKRIG